MLIGMDFDNTLTVDPELWRLFIELAVSRGHRIVCVTSRRDTEDNNETIDEWLSVHGIDIPVYFTSLGSKVDHMRKIGVKVDVWVDDSPRTCALGH